MGKQKGFRKIPGVPKKTEKRVVKVSKLPDNLQVGSNIKNVERLIEEEIEFAFWRKKLDKSFRKELERYPLLAKSVYLGCERAVDDLLDAGVNINEQIMDGSTPLLIAVDKGHVTILQKLLKAGADFRLSRNNGMNAFMIAVSKNDDKVFSLLWNHFDKKDNWILNQENSDGYTLLIIAAERGFVEYVRFFSRLGVVKVDHQAKDGRSALMLAALRSQPEIVKCLLECGAGVLLEDKAGCTALCVALSQEQPDIEEMLLETLNKKDREVYVKKRVELLAKPRQYSPFEITNSYKKMLFRVLLEVKKVMENGKEFLFKYKVYFALLKCIESNQSDPDLLWQAFHLAACLMYDGIPNSVIVLKDFADQFVDAKGPEISLGIMTSNLYKNNTDIKEAAFMPIQASVQCSSGKLWLKEYYYQIQKFVTEFKSNLPFMKFWVKEEIVQAKIIFKRFEEEMHSIASEKENSNCVPNEALPITNRDPLNNYEYSSLDAESVESDFKCLPSCTEVITSRESNSVPSSTVNIQAKKKNEIPRKIKNIKFHTKFDKKSKLKTEFYRKDINFSLSKNFPRRMNGSSGSQTGYADALKKNLNYKTEDESKLEYLSVGSDENSLQQNNLNNDSLLNVKSSCRIKETNQNDFPRHSVSSNTTHDINDKQADSFKSYASVASQNTETNITSLINKTDNTPKLEKENPNKLKDIYNIWNKVREPYKLLSFIKKFYPSSNTLDYQKPSSKVIPEEEKPILDSSGNSLNEEAGFGSEAKNSNLIEDVNLKDSDNLFKNGSKKFETCSINYEARPEFAEDSPKDCSPDFQSELNRVDLEAENLYCLLESLDVKEQNLKNSKVNFANGEMSITKEISPQTSAICPDELCKEEDNADDIFYNTRTKFYDSNNLNLNESRDIIRRTYSDVTRTNITHAIENVKNYLIEKIDETHESVQTNDALSQFEHFENISSSNQEFENGYEQIDAQLISEQTDSNPVPKSDAESTSTNVFSMNAISRKSENSSFFEEWSKRIEKDVSVRKDRLETENNELRSRVRDEKDHDEQTSQSDGSNLNFLRKFELENGLLESEKSWKKDGNLLSNFGNDTQHNYKLKCLESIRKKVISLEDSNIPPITCKLKLHSLQKYLSLYQRLIYYNLQNRGVQKLNQSKTNLDYSNNNPELIFDKPHKKKITVFTENRQTSPSVAETRSNNSTETKPHPEEPTFINFINNLSKAAAVKTQKNNSDPLYRKVSSFDPRSSGEYRRKAARDETLKRRRAFMSREHFDCQSDSDTVRFLNTGYVSSFINCEVGSKWFSVLRSLQYCVPLSQHLLYSNSVEATDSAKPAYIHHFDSSVGEIVFCTKMELTLRDG
ncbi:uncharacterized protein NPIL_50541 [Nephila pilipes]|uniref:Uncharacterized protein n=1 Tax=Nephila pilipes TaxID=299642 RepID=A0A8X6QZI9_NEPPI|nr:uncharacterized protein NPIL_50541 [Nephila pilipes]